EVDVLLEERRHDHEDDEENEDDVDQRRDVDLRVRRRGRLDDQRLSHFFSCTARATPWAPAVLARAITLRTSPTVRRSSPLSMTFLPGSFRSAAETASSRR